MNRPGSEESTLIIGDRVKAQRAEPARGTWKRYRARVGTVVSLNRPSFGDHGQRGDYVEIGVAFGAVDVDNLKAVAADVWFRADELVRVPGRAAGLRPAVRAVCQVLSVVTAVAA